MTERGRAEQALQDSEARLASAAELAELAFYEVRLDERMAFVDDRFRDICGLGAAPLTGLEALDLWMERLLAGSQTDILRGVRDGLVRLSEDVHALAYQLHPSVLDDLGLVEALRTECDRVGRQGRLEVSAELDAPGRAIAGDTALCLFRVAQEALSNAVRHADARHASVVLRVMDDGLLLAVRDDGVGFDPAEARQRRSLGLASMRERLQLIDGTLDIDSAPGHGTTIVAWAPTGTSR